MRVSLHIKSLIPLGLLVLSLSLHTDVGAQTIYDVNGVVYSPDNKPLANVLVTLENHSRAQIGQDVTNTDGRYQFNGLVAGVRQDTGQFALPEALGERFEARECFHHDGRAGWAWAGSGDLRVLRKAPEHALVRKTPCQGTPWFRMRVGFGGPLGGGPVLKED